jgi:hypothetical protein
LSPAGQIAQQTARYATVRVELRSRLIQQQHFGGLCQGCRQHQSPLLPA